MPSNDRRAIGHLLRVLGLAFGLAVVVGGVVGQGILRAPGIVAGAVPTPWMILLLWVLGGALALIDACSLVEVGASVPLEGGPYALARRAYGPTFGIVIGWADWINSALVVAFLSVVFGEYCQRLGIGGDRPIWSLSLGLIAVCAAINWTGTRFSGSSQTAFSALKGISLIVLIGALYLVPAQHSVVPAAGAATMVTSSTGIAALVIAMGAVFNTYSGWNSSIYFGEEIVNPGRNIVRATFGGILFVIALYVAVNLALLHVLTPMQMAVSKLPAADAAMRVFGNKGETLISFLSLLSVGAITNLYIMLNSRVGFSMARDGVLPRRLARTSRSGTPRLALAATVLIAGATAASGTYDEIVSATVALSLAMAVSMNLSAIVMRLKEPTLLRPFKMPLYPLPAVIGMLLNLALLIGIVLTDPWHSAIGIGAAALLGAGYALLSTASGEGPPTAAAVRYQDG